MRYSSSTKTVSWFVKQHEQNKLAFDHPLQRPVDCWSPEQKSLLIHSLLAEYPINPIYVIEENGILYPIDGLQRIWSTIMYMENKYRLSTKTPILELKSYDDEKNVINKTFEIAGKRFDKLDDELAEILKNANITMVKMTDCTYDDIKEVFRRQNLSIPLNAKLLRVTYESEELLGVVNDLSRYPVIMKMCTKAQIKNGANKDLIRQTLMLVNTDLDNGEDYTSFRKDDINRFVSDYKINKNQITMLGDVLTTLDGYFEDNIKMPITSAPMFLYAAYNVKQNNKEMDNFVTLANKFIENYSSNEKYKATCSRGTNSRENVLYRYNYWKNLVNGLKVDKKPKKEDTSAATETTTSSEQK